MLQYQSLTPPVSTSPDSRSGFGHWLRGLFPSFRADSRAEIGRRKLHLAHLDTPRIVASTREMRAALVVRALLCVAAIGDRANLLPVTHDARSK